MYKEKRYLSTRTTHTRSVVSRLFDCLGVHANHTEIAFPLVDQRKQQVPSRQRAAAIRGSLQVV